MHWMFAGYVSSFWLVLVVHAIATIADHPRPLHGLAASILIIPGLIAALSYEAVLFAPDNWIQRIRESMMGGTLTRTLAFGAGALAGGTVILCIVSAAIFHQQVEAGTIPTLKEHEDGIFWGGALALLFLAALAPVVPAAWLARRAKAKPEAEESSSLRSSK